MMPCTAMRPLQGFSAPRRQVSVLMKVCKVASAARSTNSHQFQKARSPHPRFRAGSPGGPPVSGSVVLTQLSMTARGLSGVPLGLKLSVSGRVSGNWSSGTATAVPSPPSAEQTEAHMNSLDVEQSVPGRGAGPRARGQQCHHRPLQQTADRLGTVNTARSDSS